MDPSLPVDPSSPTVKLPPPPPPPRGLAIHCDQHVTSPEGIVECPDTFNTMDELMEHQRTPHIQTTRAMPLQYEYDAWEKVEKKSTVELIREVAGDRLTEAMVEDIEEREAAVRARTRGQSPSSRDVRPKYRDVLLTRHAPVVAVRGVSQLPPSSSYIPRCRMVAVEPSLELPNVPWWDRVTFKVLAHKVSERRSYRTGQSYPNPPFPPTMSTNWVPLKSTRATPPPPGTLPKFGPANFTERGSSVEYNTSWLGRFLKNCVPKRPKSGKSASPPPPAPKSPHSTASIMAERRNHEVCMAKRQKAKSSCAPQPSNGAPSPPKGAPSPPRGTPSPPKGAPSPPRGTPSPPRGAPSPPRGAPSPRRGAPSPRRGAPLGRPSVTFNPVFHPVFLDLNPLKVQVTSSEMLT